MNEVFYKVTDDHPAHANNETDMHDYDHELGYLDKVFNVQQLPDLIIIDQSIGS
jgi:hypothetical protein